MSRTSLMHECFNLRRAFPLLILLACLPVGAKAAVTAPPAKVTSPVPYAAHFIERRSIPDMKQPLVLSGTIRFTPGRHLLWAVEKPYHYRFEIAGKTIEQTLPDGSQKREALAKTPWAAALFKLFSALLGGDPQALTRYFDLTRSGDKRVLIPRSRVLAKWVTRIVAVGAPLPHTVTIVGVDGAETRIEFTPIGEAPPPPIQPAAAATQ
ncbi:MAG: LolA family protein [Gammaproteobacteria bacterium]